jgi:CRISPR-associated endoribonuclease Cas6
LTEAAGNELQKLLNSSINEIALDSTGERYSIDAKTVTSKSITDISRIFYEVSSQSKFKIHFKTSTSFKQNNKYVFYPNIRLIFQSLMMKYYYFVEGNKEPNAELLDEIEKKLYIASYNLKSSYFPIHNATVPGFIGTIAVNSKAGDSLNRYIQMLLEFGKYSGVGKSCALGMGAIDFEGLKKNVA